MLLKLKKNKKGFTLIELIVVVAIIAILAAIAVPSFIGMQNRAKEGVVIANASAIAGAINIYNATYETPITDNDDGMDALSGKGLMPTFDTNATKQADAVTAALDKVSVDATSHIAIVDSTYTH